MVIDVHVHPTGYSLISQDPAERKFRDKVFQRKYDESKLQDLWENEQINFFIARIILNQYRSSNSPFHAIFRKYQERSLSIGDGISINALDKII